MMKFYGWLALRHIHCHDTTTPVNKTRKPYRQPAEWMVRSLAIAFWTAVINTYSIIIICERHDGGTCGGLVLKFKMPINKRAIISGALAATASSISKLALSPESPAPSTFHSYCQIIFNRFHQEQNHNGWICPYVSLGTRVVCFLCMICVNVLMVSQFIDGMNESGSVVGTALSTAANFSFSVSSCWCWCCCWMENITILHCSYVQYILLFLLIGLLNHAHTKSSL